MGQSPGAGPGSFLASPSKTAGAPKTVRYWRRDIKDCSGTASRLCASPLGEARASAGREVIIALEIRQQPGMLRLPAQLLPGERARGRRIQAEKTAYPAKVPHRLVARFARDRHAQ